MLSYFSFGHMLYTSIADDIAPVEPQRTSFVKFEIRGNWLTWLIVMDVKTALKKFHR